MDLAPYSDRQSPNKIWFLRRDRGDCAIETFLAELDDRTLTATVQLFDRTELAGPPHNVEKFRHLRGDVHEFKIHRAVAVRYLAFGANIGWVIVLALRKPKIAALQRAIAEVQRVHDEYEGAGS
ncbi:MAG: hypothetical protein WC971_10005 [Coriobacteriia bacterium]